MMLPTTSFLKKNTFNRDLRGSHQKFYGEAPAAIVLDGFDVREVFMTVSKRGVIRGIHLQPLNPQAKIIKPLSGTVHAVTVCTNPLSANFRRSYHYTLDSESDLGLYVPGDWGVGYEVLSEESKVLYLANNIFYPEDNGVFNAFDPVVSGGVPSQEWSVSKETAVMSEADRNAPSFDEFVKSVEAKKGEALF